MLCYGWLYMWQLKSYYLMHIQSNFRPLLLNLHLLTDSKVLDPCHIQCHSTLTICLIAVGRNWSTRRKPTLKSQSGTIPCIPVMVYWWNPHPYIAMIYWWNSSAHGRHWELSVLPKDTKWQWLGSNPRWHKPTG